MNGLDFSPAGAAGPGRAIPSFYADRLRRPERRARARRPVRRAEYRPVGVRSGRCRARTMRALTARIGGDPGAAGGGARSTWPTARRTTCGPMATAPSSEQSATLAALERGDADDARRWTGERPADMTGASPALRTRDRRGEDARPTIRALGRGGSAEAAPGRRASARRITTGTLQNVELSPYSWDAAGRCCSSASSIARSPRCGWRKRATARCRRSREIDDPAAYRRMAEAKTAKFNDFLVAAGLVPDRPISARRWRRRPATMSPPADRNFFCHGTALDPLPLLSPFHPLDRAGAAEARAASPSPIRARAAAVQHLRRSLRGLRHRDGGDA